MNLWYTLDETCMPVPCKSVDEYHKWHTSMPETSDWYAMKTGIGFSVAKTDLPDGRRVSTVYLGMDHSFGDGPPLLWETMVFPEASICERHETLEQAIQGHREICDGCAKKA
jgi:hypothetical protein